MKSNEETLVTAALLHDLGKYLRRCKKDTRSHEDYAYEIISNLLLNSPFNPEEKEMIRKLIEFHHCQRKNEEPPSEIKKELKLLIDADHLSAGERDEPKDSEKISSAERAPMKNIFNDYVYFHAYPLILSEDIIQNQNLNAHFISENGNYGFIFEIRKKQQPTTQEAYTERLFDIFNENVRKLKIKNKKQYIDALTTVLRNYLQFVPASTYKTLTDISLFEHLKTTAMIMLGKLRSNGKLILVIFDISGIQRFILMKKKQLEDTKAYIKSSRGRSFYISILTDAIWKYVKKEFNLYDFNLVRNVGGNLMFIMPWQKNFEEKLEKIENNINSYLLSNFGTTISVSYGFSEIQEKCLKIPECLKIKIEEAFQEVGKRKLHKYEGLLSKLDFKNSEYRILPHQTICKICERKEQMKNKEYCSVCDRLIEIGKVLVNDELVILLYYGEKNKNNSLVFKFGEFSITYLINKREENIYSEVNGKCDEIYFVNFFPNVKKFDFRTPFNIIFLGFYAPKQEQNGERSIMTLEELCEYREKTNNDENKELCRLGCLSSDVDKLSDAIDKIFRFENEKEREYNKPKFTISRYMFFVSLLDLFHALYVRNIAKRYNIYVAFAGGDDVKIFGRLDNVLLFSAEYSKCFSQIFYNPFTKKLTFSFGIAHSSPKFPAYSLMNIAEKEEKYAKKVNDLENVHQLKGFGRIWETTIPIFINIDKKSEPLLIDAIKIAYKFKEYGLSKSKAYAIKDIVDKYFDSKYKIIFSQGNSDLLKNKELIICPHPYILYSLRDIKNKETKRALSELFISFFKNDDSEVWDISKLRLSLRLYLFFERYKISENTTLLDILYDQLKEKAGGE